MSFHSKLTETLKTDPRKFRVEDPIAFDVLKAAHCSEMEGAAFTFSDEDKALNRAFYGEGR